MRYLTFFILIFSLLACNAEQKETRYAFTNFDLFEHPKQLPETFPAAFFYKDAPFLTAGNYGSGSYRYNRQGVLIQSSSDSRQTIKQYYTAKFEKRGWQVIQSVEQTDVSMVMAESDSRRLITVIMRGDNPVEIKLYYKPVSLF